MIVLVVLYLASKWVNSFSLSIQVSSPYDVSKLDVVLGFSINTKRYISKLELDPLCLKMDIFSGLTPLNYWIESGCGTNFTFIFVSVPSVPPSGVSLNITSISQPSTKQGGFNGSLLYIYDTDCPTDKTPVSFNENFYLTITDTTSTGIKSPGHSHYCSTQTLITQDLSFEKCTCFVFSLTKIAWDVNNLHEACRNKHTHQNDNSGVLPAVDLRLCDGGNKFNLTEGFIGMFIESTYDLSYSAPLYSNKYLRLAKEDETPGITHARFDHKHKYGNENMKDKSTLGGCSTTNLVEDRDYHPEEKWYAKPHNHDTGFYWQAEAGTSEPLTLNVILAKKIIDMEQIHIHPNERDYGLLFLMEPLENDVYPLGYKRIKKYHEKYLMAVESENVGKITGYHNHSHLINDIYYDYPTDYLSIQTQGFPYDGSNTGVSDHHVHPFPSPLFSSIVENQGIYDRRAYALVKRVWDNEYIVVVNYEQCDPECGEKMFCKDVNVCECIDGWQGENCTEPICNPVCGNNSDCVSPFNCECKEQFTGPSPYIDCNFPVCDAPKCKVNSECVDYNVCECMEGWVGPHPYDNCSGSVWTCGSLQCTNTSACVAQDVCECKSGWVGGAPYTDEECINPQCSKVKCTVNSECVGPDECKCIENYESEYPDNSYCNLPVCSQGCVNGTCIAIGFCQCNNGWQGDACSEKKDDSDEGNNDEDDNDDNNAVQFPSWIYGVIGGGAGVAILAVVILIIIFVLVVICILCAIKKGGSRKSTFGDVEMDETCAVEIQINKKLFEIPIDEIKLVEKIGTGGGGAEVFKSTWKGNDCAYKLFKMSELFLSDNQDSFDSVEREISVVSSISHPNIIRFFGASCSPPRIGILMELCEKGDLEKWVLTDDTEKTLINKMKILKGIICGIEYLHSRDIIHRDIKPQNVLLKDDLTPKLIDFGISRGMSALENMKTKRVGTSYFMAPEVISSGKYDQGVDIFSFSIMSYMVFSENIYPYGKGEGEAVILRVANDPSMRPVITMEFDGYDWFVEIMKKGWNHDPNERQNAKELFEIFAEKVEELESGNGNKKKIEM